MLYALISGVKQRATPDSTAKCPCCDSDVIPKCGEINIWHWAHKSKSPNCEVKPETQWHLFWKSKLPKNQCEVIIIKDGKKRIADAITTKGKIIEFQHSPISSFEISSRESFYGIDKMIWLFDIRDAYFHHRFDLRKNKGYYTFRWKHAKKSIEFCKAPVYFDIGFQHTDYPYDDPKIFRLKKINTEPPVGGWGYLGSYSKFIDYLNT